MTFLDAPTPPKRRVPVRLLSVLVLALVMVIGLGTGAHAVSGTASGPVAASPAGDVAQGEEPSACVNTANTKTVRDSQLLPIDRWSSSMPFHSRVNTDLLSMDFLGQAQRDMLAGNMLSAGNMLWGATSAATTFSLQFCPLDNVGHAIDQAAAAIGSMIYNNSGATVLFVVLLVASLLVPIGRSMRRGASFPWKEIATKIVVAGVLVLMIGGAMRSTDTSYGTFSPGWTMSTLSETINDVATVPATLTQLDQVVGDSPFTEGGDPMSCQVYTYQMKELYTNMYGGLSAASLPLVLNNMWVNTGLQAWKYGQFGDNKYADLVYCRLLDNFNDIPVGAASSDSYQGQWVATQLGVMAQVGHEYDTSVGAFEPGYRKTWPADVLPMPHPNSLAFNYHTPTTTDVSIISWAACTAEGGNLTYRFSEGADDQVLRPDGDTKDASGQQSCYGWWTKPAAGDEGFQTDGAAFNWQPKNATVLKWTQGQPQARDFILNLHAQKPGSSTTAAVGFAVSALLVLLVFGGLSLLVSVVKVLSLVLMLTMLAALLMALIPGPAGSQVLKRYGGKALGTLVLAAGAVFLFSVVGALTAIITSLGVGGLGGTDGFFSPGTVGAMMWVGLAPLAVVLTMSYLFKHVFKIPNPLSLKGAGAWMKSSGALASAAGGAVGAAAGGGAISRGARNLGHRASKSAGDAVVSKVTGGRMGTHGGGKPAGLQPKSKTQGMKSEAGTGADTAAALGAVGGAAGGVAGAAGAQSGEVGGQEKQGKKPKKAGLFGKTTAEQKRQRASARRAGEEALLAELGISRDAPRKEKRQALGAHYKEKTKDAKRLDRAEQAAKNGPDIKRALDERRLETGTRLTGKDYAKAARSSVTRRAKAGMENTKERARQTRQAFAAAPAATTWSAAKKTLKTGSKVAGVGLAAGALGPALAPAAGVYAGVKAARKAAGVAGERGARRTDMALEALARKNETDRLAAQQSENGQNGGDGSGGSQGQEAGGEAAGGQPEQAGTSAGAGDGPDQGATE